MKIIEISTDEPIEIRRVFHNYVSTHPKMQDFTVYDIHLPCGDYHFQNLGFERKMLNDFIGSIIDGRIFKQAFNMSKTYTYCYLIAVGNISHLTEKEQKMVYTTIADIECRYGFRVLFVPTMEMFCHIVTILCYKLSKNLQPIWRFEKKTPSVNDEQIQVICGMYNVGQKKAIQILTAFPTLSELFSATLEQLQDILPEKLSQHIYEVGHKKWQKNSSM